MSPWSAAALPGLSAAIALAQARRQHRAGRPPRALCRQPHHRPAWAAPSISWRQLDVWPRCKDQAAPLQTMRLVDDTGRLIRAPEVRFSCDEIGLDAFGYNIENRSLIAALEAARRRAFRPDAVRRRGRYRSARTMRWSRSAPAMGTSLSARLVVGADGRHSLCREAAGIDVRRRDLNQAALTFNVSHSRPHRNISTEFHTPQGPCVFVPLPGNRCSVVWVAAPREAARLMAFGDDELVGGCRNGNRIPFSAASRSSRDAICFRSRSNSPGNSRKPSHRAGRRGRACAAADRRAGPEYGTARCRRYRRYRAARRWHRAKIRRAAVLTALRFGAARRCR